MLTVEEFFSQIPKDRTIYYRANPGNAGDALIATGALLLFEKLSLNVELINLNSFDAKGKIVVYAGGGNLVGIYPEARTFFEKFHKDAEQLILLPHTVFKNEDLIPKLGSNVTIFAREKISYEHLCKHKTKAKIYIDHDLALRIDAGKLLNKSLPGITEVCFRKIKYKVLKDWESYSAVPSIKLMLKNTFFEIKSSLFLKSGVGIFFRSDIEAFDRKVPKNNSDLSVIYEHGTKNWSLTTYTAVRMLKYIDRFKVVKTDRLHVCIAAALLGKNVEFYPNSYYKCKAVYEFSLKDRYPNIRWMAY